MYMFQWRLLSFHFFFLLTIHFHAQVIDYYYYFYISFYIFFSLVVFAANENGFSHTMAQFTFFHWISMNPAGCKSVFGLFLPFFFPSMAFKWPSHAYLDEKNTSIVNKLLQFLVVCSCEHRIRSLNGVNFDDAGQTVGFILPFFSFLCFSLFAKRKTLQSAKKIQ